MTRQEKIRNFSIIAHIDHGKSTLADRLIETTGLLTKREMTQQVLDKMDIERERGITIKLQTVRLTYKDENGEEYHLNLIDTPGHVDFTYEVSRSLAACEGALLVVDATQGVQAQTLANCYLALDNDLEIVPVINKVDLASADVERTKMEIEDVIGIDTHECPLISAKEGLNIQDVLKSIVQKIPPPKNNDDKPLRALVFDSFYDAYRGVVCSVRIVDGCVKEDDEILFMASNKSFKVEEVGIFTSTLKKVDALYSGEVGYICASIKEITHTRVGDTITLKNSPAKEPLKGYKSVMPMVYCGVYPADGSKYDDLKDALLKLKLNDASLTYDNETSVALGFGFRCGFLGLLHLEVTLDRLSREFDMDLVTTSPGVVYKVHTNQGTQLEIDNPTNLPDPTNIDYMEEPFVKASIMTPNEYIGSVMDLCQSRRGIFKTTEYIESTRALLHYELPLNEIIYDFFDNLKSRTRGYASLDYEFLEYRKSSLVKLDILLNHELVDAFSMIVHSDSAVKRGRSMAEKLQKQIPRQMFEIPIQAAIGGKVIARETVRAMRKDVLAKCYGGDISRKRKLLEKQKEGKKKMRSIGKVQIPQEAFVAVLKLDE